MFGPMSDRKMEVGCIQPKDVITTDGRRVGSLSGAWIDVGTWTVTSLTVNLDKTVVDELSLKKPLLRSAKTNIPTSLIKNISDVAQLNINMATLSTMLQNAP